MKPGTINVEIEEEKILWFDRKRTPIFGLPWSFTKYTLTETRLLIKKGFFKQIEDEIRLYRCVDVTYQQNLFERLNKTGTIIVESSDNSMKIARLVHVKNADKVKEVISCAIESVRQNTGVKTSEFVQ